MLRVFFGIVLIFCGCSTTSPTTRNSAPLTAEDQTLAVRNQAYSLLFGLLSDEKNVSKLLLIKKENADIGDLLKDISRTSAEASRQLEAWEKQDSHLHLNMTGLPRAEQETRDLISKTKAKELIAKTGDKFEIRILLAQAEALSYGAHLAIITSKHESDPARQKFLVKTSEDLQELHQRLIDLMHTRWRAPDPKSNSSSPKRQ
jgi:hypothetical protein